MNLTISGHHLEVTPALREYVLTKLDRVTRHFDQVVSVSVMLRFDKHKKKSDCNTVEIDLHVKARDFHAGYTNGDMYTTIDQVVNMLDRQIMAHKGKLKDHHRDGCPKRDPAVALI